MRTMKIDEIENGIEELLLETINVTKGNFHNYTTESLYFFTESIKNLSESYERISNFNLKASGSRS